MAAIEKIALDCRDFDNDWCGEGSDRIETYLTSLGIECDLYAPSFGIFGGINIDDSHAWAVLADGTIIDATITQYRDAPRASSEQKRAIEGFPTLPGSEYIAVIPVGHPFIQQLQYESHIVGKGWRSRPPWFKGEWEGLTREERRRIYGTEEEE